MGCGLLGPLGVRAASDLPHVELPEGLELVVAAAPPLVRHPLMGCVDDRGRLFIGDAAGLNLDKASLEQQLPNRVLMLEDVDGDGIYDRSTVFADRMTYPSGACWLDGSLYVASPPGIWKLTDTNGDGIADQREMIVGGFTGWTGNGTHVHGPVLHPTNGRLFWCTGQSGRVVQQDGTLVRDGRMTGVWSCNPDGSEIEWHSLGIMDNPVEVDFTADGQLVGTVNLQFHQPRGDTLVQWLFGGVYESPDTPVRGSTHADLPHTLERMPVVHNFGHVAVSGFTRYRSGALNPAWKDEVFVTFFNTQKIVRAHLISEGATYRATEHEFLKFNDPDAHFTDVIEDGDGTLLALNTGGWVRRGCPSSLSEKPDLRGAIYRIRRRGQVPPADPYGLAIPWAALSPAETVALQTDDRWMVRERAVRLAARGLRPVATARELLDTANPHGQVRACELIARARRIDPGQRDALLKILGAPLDPALEHAALFAAIATGTFDGETLRQAASPTLIRRLMIVMEAKAADPAVADSLLNVAKAHFDSSDAELATTAVAIAARHPRVLEHCQEELNARLGRRQVSPGTLNLLIEVTGAHLAQTPAQKLVTAMLQHPEPAIRRTAWRIIARQPGEVSNPEWFGLLDESLADAAVGPGGADLQLLFDAIGKLRSAHFDRALRRISNEAERPQPVRLRALAALSRPNEPLESAAFAYLLDILTNGTSPTARIDAAGLLARVRLSKEQIHEMAPVLATAAPVELLKLLRPMQKKLDATTAPVWAVSLARSPYFGSIEESVVKSGFQSLSSDVYERILGPSVRAAAAANDAKKRRLDALAAGAAQGRAHEGRKVFESSACLACHKVGDLGRAMGPDLTHIGRIRKSRDLLEAILLPNATLARNFETYVVETSEGQSVTGTIKSDATDALLLVDFAGEETLIPRAQIVGQTAVPTSLMPDLEQAFTEQQLLDLVAWLASLK